MTGQNIRRIRRARGISQWDLAQAVGVRAGTIVMIERNKVECPPQLLAKIAAALGTTADQLRKE